MSVNKVILIGNVGKEPEVRYLDNGTCVANLTLATTERGYTASNGTQIPDRTEWHNIVLWRGLASIVEKYVHKGSQIYIEGKLRTRTWNDQQGVQRYTTEIYADNLNLLGKRNDGAATTSAAAPAAQPTPSAAATQTFTTNNSSDDLPF